MGTPLRLAIDAEAPPTGVERAIAAGGKAPAWWVLGLGAEAPAKAEQLRPWLDHIEDEQAALEWHLGPSELARWLPRALHLARRLVLALPSAALAPEGPAAAEWARARVAIESARSSGARSAELHLRVGGADWPAFDAAAWIAGLAGLGVTRVVLRWPEDSAPDQATARRMAEAARRANLRLVAAGPPSGRPAATLAEGQLHVASDGSLGICCRAATGVERIPAEALPQLEASVQTVSRGSGGAAQPTSPADRPAPIPGGPEQAALPSDSDPDVEPAGEPISLGLCARCPLCEEEVHGLEELEAP